MITPSIGRTESIPMNTLVGLDIPLSNTCTGKSYKTMSSLANQLIISRKVCSSIIFTVPSF